MMYDRNMMEFRQQCPPDADTVVLLRPLGQLSPSCVERRLPSRPPRHRGLGCRIHMPARTSRSQTRGLGPSGIGLTFEK